MHTCSYFTKSLRCTAAAYASSRIGFEISNFGNFVQILDFSLMVSSPWLSMLPKCSLATAKNRSFPVLVNWTQVRYRKAVSFRHYQQPHLRQKLLLAVCEPVLAKPRLPDSEKCTHLRLPPPRPDHPWDVLLAKDMTNELAESQLVCLFHQNQMSGPDQRLISNEFQHENMAFRFYNRDIVRICLQDKPWYSPLMQFAVGYPFTVLFAPDLTKIDKIFKISRKYPQVVLMCAMVERRRLVTVSQLQQLAKIGDLDQQRVTLCHTLSLNCQSLIQTLGHHTSQLSQLLKTHAGPGEDGNGSEKQKI